MILFEKRGEFKWLAVPGYWRQHLGVARDAAFIGEEHQFSDCARLHRPLQTKQAAGYGNNLQLRGAPDAARKPNHHRGFFFESDALRPFAKFSLGGVGHELSIKVFWRKREITEGQKICQHLAKFNMIAPKPALDGEFKARAKSHGSRHYNFRQKPKPLGPDFDFDSRGAV